MAELEMVSVTKMVNVALLLWMVWSYVLQWVVAETKMVTRGSFKEDYEVPNCLLFTLMEAKAD